VAGIICQALAARHGMCCHLPQETRGYDMGYDMEDDVAGSICEALPALRGGVQRRRAPRYVAHQLLRRPVPAIVYGLTDTARHVIKRMYTLVSCLEPYV